MEKKDLLKLNSKDLASYVIGGQIYDDLSEKDSDFADLVSLLYYAQPDEDKARSILERVIKEGKKLSVVYPMLGEKKTPDMEYIGDIMDGALYIE